jgi:molybdopterin molybdotransferase
MISVQEAERIILKQVFVPSTEILPLSLALGRILAEPLCADRDFPPFTRVSMDGIAICFQAFEDGRRRFRIQETQMAGQAPAVLQNDEYCIEIMTGAVLPIGADTIIRYEDLQLEDGYAIIQIDDVKSGQNAHLQGIDRQAGEELVPPNRLIGPAEIGVAATVGAHMVTVLQCPRIWVIPTGDELVPIYEQPLPHQIRHSNGPTLQALCQSWGAKVEQHSLRDNLADIRALLGKALDGTQQALIFTGSVSKGKTDYLPTELERAGVEKFFHLVQQRPGKPFWFGRHPNGTVVFALPGNPVSSFIGCIRYVLPWFRASMGLSPAMPSVPAVLEQEHTFKPQLTLFLPVRVSVASDGRILAQPVPGQGSGDLANLVDADGFLELPAEQNHFSAGEIYPLWLWRNHFGSA